jgi:hypothetical protein
MRDRATEDAITTPNSLPPTANTSLMSNETPKPLFYLSPFRAVIDVKAKYINE